MLSDFITARNLQAEIIDCKQPVMTVKQACSEMNCSAADIIKSILFVDEKKNAVLAIVLGSDRIGLKRLETIVGAENLRIATEKEVDAITGYEAGGVPPISIFGIRTIIDKRVMERQTVIGGGGDEMHLLRISTKELLENAFEPSVEEIAE